MAFDLSQFKQRIGAMVRNLSDSAAEALVHMPKNESASSSGHASPSIVTARTETSAASSLTHALVGSIGMLGEYYFPSELIGGTCPRIVGEEEEIVWNAAAEACDTERVHVVWQSTQNKVWYLAVRSNEMASHTGTWCPFSSLLPGMKDAVAPPIIYTYYSDETATMMAVTADGLQIYRGTTLVVRAKAERTARELGDAPVVELVPDRILRLTPVPWYSLSLFEDRARRVLAAISVVSALSLAALAFLVWFSASLSLLSARHDLSAAQERTEKKTTELMATVERLRASPMRDQLAKFADLNDGLLNMNGFLEVYEVKNGKTRWRAILPSNVTADRINELGGKTIENTDQGVAIGNAAQIEFEATEGKRRR
jgi:hypothetical protein